MLRRARDAVSFLLGAVRVRRRSRMAIYGLSGLLGLSGFGMLSYPFVTDLYSLRLQSSLSDEFASPEFEKNFSAGTIADGQVLTRIEIPKIGVDALVVEGTDPGALRAGAGHYKGTAFPCAPGNVGIAGHRTTYGKPFNRIDELVAGDELTLSTPQKKCTYRVVDAGPGKERPRRGAAGWITHPKDGAVIGKLPGQNLTLTTCHPKGSAAKRLIVRAELVESA